MKFWPTALVALSVGVTAVACGSSDDSVFGNGDAGVDGDLGDDGSVQGTPDGGFVTSDGGGGNSNCKPRTCAQAGANCGPIGDGCGGLLQCGTCTAPESCGAGGKASVCGGVTKCTKKTCNDFPSGSCGPLADGCGGLITCGTCTAPQTCGGGGTASVCGGNTGCVPKTQANCAAANIQCGPMADGCGGFVDCGSCPSNQSCGAAGPSKCGSSGVDAGTCTPKTCANYPSNACGPLPDGCGGVLTTCGTNSNGSCTAPQTCGGGGTPSVCGGSSGCVPKTCGQLGAQCGPAGDGCGGVIPDCGPCTAPQTCGGGGTPSVCGGTNACVKKTCADYPANSCGPLADGCGGTITCGTGCVAPQICGGGGTPSVCGGNDAGAVADAGCTGLCLQQVTCDGGGTTTITGTVRAPTPSTFLATGTKADPIPDAVVFVPNGAVSAFSTTVSCSQCGADVSGTPLVKTFSNFDGTFTLTNVPAGANIPLVIQKGRWRRKITIANVPACGTVNLTDDQSRLPRWQGEGDPADNIPQMAIVTGNVDTLECVLRKIGIDQREFVGPDITGRVHMYQGWDNGGGTSGHRGERPPKNKGTTTNGTALYSTNGGAALNNYDAVLLPCEGGQITRNSTDQGNFVNYTNAGGRLFSTHYSYAWLYNKNPFSTTSAWNVSQNNPTSNDGPITTQIDTTFTKGQQFAQWLGLVGALSNSNPAQIQVNVPRHDVDPPMDANNYTMSQRWGYTLAADNTTDGTPTINHYTFNTPVAADPTTQCGRVVFSDFHVSNADANGSRFPGACNSNPMNAQERVIEYMIFDLTSCIQPDKPVTPPTCTKRTCAQANANCGFIGDGCGGSLDCGPCTSPQTCGGGGVANQCGGSGCTKRSCQQAGANCGQIADGCGGLIDCGACNSPQTCGGGGTPNQCGNPSCVPKTCTDLGIMCGPAGDGCGNLIPNCGDCTLPQTCGGGGSAGVCGNAPCTKQSCTQAGAQCGPAADGCGGIQDCGPCPSGQVCGGGGPSICGASNCTPRTCAQAGAECGPIGDGCGGQLDCGPCTQPGQVCGGGGPSKCGGCVRTTCQAAGAQCGPIGDGCGGQLDCGTCTAPDTCGGGGVAFQCGHPQVN